MRTKARFSLLTLMVVGALLVGFVTSAASGSFRPNECSNNGGVTTCY